VQVALTWAPVTGASSYNVYRSITSGADYTLIVGGGILTSPAYIDGPGGLVNGQQYFYVVTYVTADGESVYSNEFTANPIAVPGAPTSLTGVVS